MSKIEAKLDCVEYSNEFICFIDRDYEWVELSTAKTKKTAYKRAAAKLRKLADEAERLANDV